MNKIKKVLIIGLGWQGQRFLKVFQKMGLEVIGCTNTIESRNKISDEYKINVYTDYNEAIAKNNPDCIFSAVYPVESQYKIVLDILYNYDIPILSDIPISFDYDLLANIFPNKNLYIFVMEQYFVLQEYISRHIENIANINGLLYVNKENLQNQINKSMALNVDKFFLLNNLLKFKPEDIDIKYSFVDKIIKDVEYLIKFSMLDGTQLVYKFNDGKGIIAITNNGMITDKYVDYINYDSVISNFLSLIENGINQTDIKMNYLNFCKFFITSN